jgi:hypothetical protein
MAYGSRVFHRGRVHSLLCWWSYESVSTKFLWDLDVPQMAATHLYEDNDGATAMANAGKPTPRSRHIDVKYYAIQEWVEWDSLFYSALTPRIIQQIS